MDTSKMRGKPPISGSPRVDAGLPPNPSDRIRDKGVPVVQAQAQTLRRPFSTGLVTKNPLHYSEGQGTDECLPRPVGPGAQTVTSPPDWIGKESTTGGTYPVGDNVASPIPLK